MSSFKKYLPIALLLGFILFGLSAFIQSKPSPKNERVYKTVQKYSPYYMDKRFGGLSILNKEDSEFKEKPNNMTLFKEFERLEKEWGKKHLKIENNTLIILDNNGSQQASLVFKTKDESDFARQFYGL
ncbi:hypothetical protein MNB_SV-5-941 [hydrothermal vent metagenome]|uniref:Uncharacterized protein n=1 Tax=hydrothermal vent metagenome TaxID=652676 RepID=A0A1W1EG25_9ZZZZ